jgi:hypothetical protein
MVARCYGGWVIQAPGYLIAAAVEATNFITRFPFI